MFTYALNTQVNAYTYKYSHVFKKIHRLYFVANNILHLFIQII